MAPAVVGTNRLGVFSMEIEKGLELHRQRLEIRIGIGLHPFRIELGHAVRRQRTAEKSVEPHARRHRGDRLAEMAVPRRLEKKVDIGACRLDGRDALEVDPPAFGITLVELELLQDAGDQAGEPVQVLARARIGEAEGVGTREGFEEVSVLRDITLEAFDRQRAVTQPAHEAVRQDAGGQVRVRRPQVSRKAPCPFPTAGVRRPAPGPGRRRCPRHPRGRPRCGPCRR